MTRSSEHEPPLGSTIWEQTKGAFRGAAHNRQRQIADSQAGIHSSIERFENFTNRNELTLPLAAGRLATFLAHDGEARPEILAARAAANIASRALTKVFGTFVEGL